ncbi:hypothetical protein F2Q70_00037087 [Brassica cretica]|uniref:Uncharacterized protein n=1 Tax=Brassica cretica TaxID=69181 RepID=A0A3N6QVM4_BRACR|nr:hypothetical protein F2Q70_00037087 [Brassica cretica]KAF3533699.1 hypothetical protein DY000_02042655 [Brassica cretica]
MVCNIHRSVLVRHIQEIKPIRSGVSYPGNHPLCRLGASYPRTLSWEYQQLSASIVRPFDPSISPLLVWCVISSNNWSWKYQQPSATVVRPFNPPFLIRFV